MVRNALFLLVGIGLVAGCGGGGGGGGGGGPAAPTLVSISPTGGSPLGGTALTLTGTNFDAGVTSVTIGGQGATGIGPETATSVTCATPPGSPGVVDVAITTPGGTAVLTNAFTYYTPPTIASVAPVVGLEGGGTLVQVLGTGFLAGDPGTPTVRFGGQAATGVSVSSDTVLSCTTPPGAYGWTDVEVTTANGSALLAHAFRYQGFRFVATGLNGSIVWSHDGNSWTEAPSSEVTTTSKLYDVLLGSEGRWVAVGGNWSPDHSRILHTDDVSDWSLAADSDLGTPTVLLDAAYDGTGRYVAVGMDGAGPSWVLTSDDGDDWTPAATQFGATAVAHDGAGLWVAVSYGDPGIRHSANGSTWTTASQALVPDPLTLEAVAHGGDGRWVAVGQDGLVMVSDDGDVWTEATSSRSVTGLSLYDVAHDGVTTWVAVGAGGTLLRSSDGDTWTLASEDGLDTPVDLFGVAAGEGSLWVVVGQGGTVLMSLDGDAWTPATGTATTRDLYGVGAGGG